MDKFTKQATVWQEAQDQVLRWQYEHEMQRQQWQHTTTDNMGGGGGGGGGGNHYVDSQQVAHQWSMARHLFQPRPTETNWKARHNNFAEKLAESGVVSREMIEGTRVVLSMLTLDRKNEDFLPFARYSFETSMSSVRVTELLYAAALPWSHVQAVSEQGDIRIAKGVYDMFDEVADELYEQVRAYRRGGVDQNEPRDIERSAAA